MVVVAVKVTLEPGQIDVLLAVMLIVGVTLAFTVMTILFEVAAEAPEQVLLDVSSQLTISASANVELAKLAALVPTLIPFTFHW